MNKRILAFILALVMCVSLLPFGVVADTKASGTDASSDDAVYMGKVSAIKGTTSAGKPKLTWGKISGAEKYYIYRSTDGKSFKFFKSTTETSYTDKSASLGTTYYYKVKGVAAVNGKNISSDYTDIVEIKCTTAAPIISIARSNGKAKLSWDEVKGATRYWVYRRTDGRNYEFYAGTSKTTYTDTKAASGTKYYYRVKAVTVVNEKSVASEYSNTKTLLTRIAKPELTVSHRDYRAVVYWGELRGATHYKVYRSTDGKSFQLVATVTGGYYDDFNTAVGKTYYYKVKAICESNANANSPMSDVKSVTGLPPAPKDVKVKLKNGSPVISWKNPYSSTYGIRFQIYRSTNGGKTFKCIDSTTKTSYTDKNAPSGKTCCYRVAMVQMVYRQDYVSCPSDIVSIKMTK